MYVYDGRGHTSFSCLSLILFSLKIKFMRLLRIIKTVCVFIKTSKNNLISIRLCRFSRKKCCIDWLKMKQREKKKSLFFYVFFFMFLKCAISPFTNLLTHLLSMMLFFSQSLREICGIFSLMS